MLLDFRDAAFDAVYEIAENDKKAVLLYNDMGAMGLDKIKTDFPGQVVNIGIAEQNMMSVAAGLALSGRSVFTYGIAAHVTARCYEQIKLDICSMKLPVTGLGIGSSLSYGNDGPTHHSLDDISIMRTIPEMTVYNPSDAVAAKASVLMAYENRSPAYVRLDKEQHEAIYRTNNTDFSTGLAKVADGDGVTVIATGIMVHRAIEVSKKLAEDGMPVKVIDLYRIKPSNDELLLQELSGSKAVVTLEENSCIGGIGTLVAEKIAQSGLKTAFVPLSLSDEFFLGSASRKYVNDLCSLNVDCIIKTIRELVIKK